MCKKIITILFFIFCIAKIQAQTNSYDDEEVTDTIFKNKYDADSNLLEENTISTKEYNTTFAEDVLGDTSVYFRDFILNNDSIKSWKQNNDYIWINNIDSLLRDKQKKEDKLKQKQINTGKDFGNTISGFEKFLNSGILKIILWLIAASVLIFIVYQLFLSKGVFGSAGKKTQALVETDIDVDNNMETNFEALLTKAYAVGNMRLAMRYLFLKTLQKLNDKQLIQFAVDKTNSAYAKELTQTKRNDFSKLALYYEYAWYGNIIISKDIFDEIENKFNDFLKQI